MSATGSILFDYQAVDVAGKIVAGQIAARSRRDAHRALEGRSLTPVSIETAAKDVGPKSRWFQRGPSGRDDALLMEQLALLLSAGIPLLDAVASLRGQALHPSYVESLATIEKRLRSGQAFAPSLSESFPSLPAYMGQLVAAGEATGRLGPALQDGVTQMNYDLTVRQEIRNALTYPAILVITGITAVMFIFIVVVPRFSAMLKGKLDQLPFISRLVIELGNALNNAKGFVLFLAALILVGIVIAARDARVRQKTRDLLDRAPLVGAWLLEAELARWGSMLSTMLGNGVDLIRGLQFARDSISLTRLHQKLGQITKLVRSGQSLSSAIASQQVFTPTAVSLIQVGEASGALASMLKSMADLYANSGRQRMKRFLILMEPIAILLIGGVIGGIVAAIMLAITSVNQVAL
jgi:general secretion pathway protein F